MTYSRPEKTLESLLNNLPKLEERIKEIEKVIGKATQIMVTIETSVINEVYIVGDLTRREGKYQLLMFREYYHPTKGNIPTQYGHLAGEYDSFEDIKKVIKAAEGVWLKGDEIRGFAPTLVPSEPVRVGGSPFIYQIGKIVGPLLGPDEKVKVVKF